MTAALPAFALASTLLILAPGPDSLLVLRNTLPGRVQQLPAGAVSAPARPAAAPRRPRPARCGRSAG
jgi:threonine/homoserine/homoserine lactone efflux protein